MISKEKASIESKEDIHNILQYIKDESIEDVDVIGNELHVGNYLVDIKFGYDILMGELERVFGGVEVPIWESSIERSLIVDDLTFNLY